MRHGGAGCIDLAVEISKTPRIRRPTRMTAPPELLCASGRDGRNEYYIAPNLAIQAVTHVCDLAAIGPDLRICQRWDIENRVDGPRLRCTDDVRTGSENCQQIKPGFP